jgi:hypothetical protein
MQTNKEFFVITIAGPSGVAWPIERAAYSLAANSVALITIEHLAPKQNMHYVAMKVTEKQALAVRCPTCGAKPGEKCELATGQPRTEPHRDRCLAASEK